MYKNMHKIVMLGLGSLLLVSGCALDPGARGWWTVGEGTLRGLRAGVTTQAEALKLLGTPMQKTSFSNLREESWDYRYLDGTMQMLAWVVFDDQGRYKYYVSQPDPARYSCIGG